MRPDGSYHLPEHSGKALLDPQRQICNQIVKLTEAENVWPPASSPRPMALA